MTARERWGRLATAVTLIGSLLAILWLGGENDGCPLRYTSGGNYYDLLADGFLDGHTYMRLADGVGHLDSAFYHGNSYLYYGVVPAVLTFLPYRWLTGNDLSPHFAVTLFTTIGFLFSVGLFFAAARRQLGRISPGVAVAAILALAFATATPLLLARSEFYEIPIAAGYACAMAALFFLHRAVSGAASPRAALAGASLALGLAVGCRPNYILCLPLVPLAAVLSLRPWNGRRLRGLALPTLLPAAAIGAGLAAYNYERFGSIFDFGFNYGQNWFFGSHRTLFSAAFFWTNVKWYYLTPPALSPYFPFVFPENASFLPPGFSGDEAIFGQFPVLLLAAFILVSALALRRKWRAGGLGPLLGFAAWMALASFVFTCLLGIRANRYMIDFQAALVVGLCLVAAGVSAALGAGWAARSWRAVLLLLAAAAALFNVGAGLQQFDTFRNTHLGTWAALSQVGNRPAEWARRLGWYRYGPLRLRVVFPPSPADTTIQPLFMLGSPNHDDGMYVLQTPDNRIELWMEHHGYGGIHSPLLPIVPGRTYELAVRMGALYPPPTDTFYRGLSPAAAQLLQLAVTVDFDHRNVIRGMAPSYFDSPRSLVLGRNDRSFTGYERRFDGKIVSCERLPATRELPVLTNVDGFWRLRCALPSLMGGSPVLASGITGAGNLVYLSTLPGGRIRFGLDQWGAGARESDPIVPGPGSEHTIEICVGALTSRYPWPAAWKLPAGPLAGLDRSVRVWLDGRLVFTAAVTTNFDSFDNSQVGWNSQGFSSAIPKFAGSLREDPYSPREAAAFLRQNLGLPPKPGADN